MNPICDPPLVSAPAHTVDTPKKCPPAAAEDSARAAVPSAPAQTLQDLLTPGLRSISRRASTAQASEFMLAEVQEVDADGRCQVLAPGGRCLKVMVALGCLVQPECGDLVQVFANGADGWITMVLRRQCSHSAVDLTAGGRDIRLQAPHLALVADERLQLQAQRLEQRAVRIEADAQERASTVLGSDTLRAGSASWQVEGHLGLHAHTQFVTAEGLMKINGGQIHMA